MTFNPAAAGSPPIRFDDPQSQYRAGACNIGRDEINRRWRFGHFMALTTVVLFAFLAVIDVPSIVRFVVVAPAAVAAACYLEAALKFCVRFGMLGLFNFGTHGAETKVVDDRARARDRTRAIQLAAGSCAVAMAVGLIAVVLPV